MAAPSEHVPAEIVCCASLVTYVTNIFLIVEIKNAPEQFTSEEFPVSESKVSMDVSFPGATFVVVSCKESQLGCRKE